ncbi:MAG TPA: bifunctional phosphopantothenoylcysteine decarboxylase/phosphopantothenate synthase [Solirubrobacteraceae bacterium]|nr:bifunctional phosphopantothenoylcysteine decarboxylase/phosphopantothenate synthase [Solirubrobacteraceae bacterium]
MARILLGVSGGIAAYKALEFVRLATAAGHAVRVVQTHTSQRFVGAASFAALTGAPVLSDEFEHDPARGAFPGQQPPAHEPLSHLELVRNAELYLIAPASANTLAKLAHGHADNLLSSAALAATCPLVVAPAMNNHMYEHPATAANLELLRARGVSVVEPGVGRLASKGEQGVGRLAEPAELLGAIEMVLRAHARSRAAPSELGQAPPQGPSQTGHDAAAVWQGLRVLVSAGGTREPIDSVRFVGNSSSGLMGFSLAAGAHARGAQVTVVAANVTLPRTTGIRYVDVVTAAELRQACEAEFADCDVLLMAAAVADFRPVDPDAGKLKKAGRGGLRLELEPTADVLSGLAARRGPAQTLVGFAAEHGAQALEHGRGKLTAKQLDAVVVNDISRTDIGFDVDANEVTILTAAGAQQVARASKASIAEAILNAVQQLREGGEPAAAHGGREAF